MDKRFWYILFAFTAIVLLATAGWYGVMESSDARYAEIAREMYTSGDYLHPNLLDVHHYHKPPFTYIITAFGYHLFGANPFGARFFLQVALLIQLLLVYKLTDLLFSNKKTAFWAAAIYFSFPIVLISTRNLTTDAYLNTFVLATITTWVAYRKSGKYRWLYAFALLLGLGFLTKGPVVLIIPLPFILFYNRGESAKNNFGIHHIVTIILFITISASWFIYLVIENPVFLDYFLGRQTVDRFSENAFGRTEPFWYFLAFGPLIGIPWSLILIYLIYKHKNLFSNRSNYKALLLTIVIALVFFSISSSKRILYILPIYGLLAVLNAQLLSISTEAIRKGILKMVMSFLLVILTVFIVAPWLKLDFTIPMSFSIAALVIALFFIALLRIKKINMADKSVLISSITALLLVVASSFFFAKNELQVNAVRPITEFIKYNKLNSRNILIYNTRKPSIAFGLGKSIVSLNNGDEGLARETQFETDKNWKKYLINLKDTDEVDRLKSMLQEPSVLLTYKHPVDKDFQWILKNYPNKKEMGKWVIYY